MAARWRFSFADDEVYRKTQAEKPAEIRNFDHIAFKVDAAGYDELVARIKAHGVQVRETDHGYCKSMYVESPDGLITEFTVDPPADGGQTSLNRRTPHAELARWMSGDHRVNNDLRVRETA